MSYSSDPVLDAARHYDAIAAENEAIEDLEIAATQEIMDTLTKQIRTATNLTLPAVHYGKSIVESVSISEVIQDEIGFGAPFDAIMQCLHKSDCQYVAAIREAIAKSYADSTATEIAQMRYAP